MDTIVKLENVMKGMKVHTDKTLPFLNKNTGAVVYTQHAFLLDAKGEEYVGDLLDWQLREMELAYDIVERRDKYIEVPALNWVGLREQFCAMQSGKVQGLLETAASNDVAAFKAILTQQGLVSTWEKFVEEKAEMSAAAFCQEYGLNYKTS